MRFRLALAAVCGAVLGAVLLATPAVSQAPNRPLVQGAYVGEYDVSQGSSWSDLTAASFTTTTGRALAAGDCFVSVMVTNTHATQTLRVLLRANAGEAATVGHLVPAGATRSYEIWGSGSATIAIYGSGAATTGAIDAIFVRGGC